MNRIRSAPDAIKACAAILDLGNIGALDVILEVSHLLLGLTGKYKFVLFDVVCEACYQLTK